jgi:NADH dehydrogenase
MGESSATPHVVIIGGGFAGLWCTRALASAPVRITLVDKANHHLFQPLLYQVATAGLAAADIAAPLRHILRRQRNVQVLMAEVSGIDVAAKTVQLGGTVASRPLPYDLLLVASGATHAYFGHDEWAANAPGLKTLDDALAIRRRLLLAFEQAEAATGEAERRAWLHFAIVGGGPTGVELAGTVAELARHTLRQEFRQFDPRQALVRLIEAGAAPLASFPPALQQRTKAQLTSLGVEVCCGTPVASITDQGYRLGDRFVACRTVLWAAGVAASPLGAMLGVPLDRAGRVRVNADLTLPGHPEVFVAGDLAAMLQPDGQPVPGIAPAAKQMGTHVARSLRARLTGVSAQPFVYADHGNLATIGRMAAVVELRGFQFSGLLAWWFWLAAHIFFLIGFRNRVSVLLNWALAYWTYQRGARIVLGQDRFTENSPRP